MRPGRIEVSFYETYYFANAVRNIVCDPTPYLRNLDAFHGDDKHLDYCRPFPRFSAFHAFLTFIIEDLILDLNEIDLEERQARAKRFAGAPHLLRPHPSVLPFNEALLHYGIAHVSLNEWLQTRGKSFTEVDDEDLEAYCDDLCAHGSLEKLLDRAVEETFFVLFASRRVLFGFNRLMAGEMGRTDPADLQQKHAECFAKTGVLRRVHMPSWVKRAVFYRDRGRCVLCSRDLSGILSIDAEEHYDHIVPLQQGGLNDVTNVQLLCAECNRKKSGGRPVTSDLYESWYPMDDKA